MDGITLVSKEETETLVTKCPYCGDFVLSKWVVGGGMLSKPQYVLVGDVIYHDTCWDLLVIEHPTEGEGMRFQTLFKLGMDRDLGEIKDMGIKPRWWKDEQGEFSPIIINVGAGNKHIWGAASLDYPEWNADTDPLPYANGTVNGIHCYHFLEHVKEPVAMLQEFQRVLAPGGLVNIVVPYYNAQIFAHDLDHKHAFCEDTWKILFKNPYYNKNQIDWRFQINFNMIAAIVERNLSLFTQLEKV